MEILSTGLGRVMGVTLVDVKKGRRGLLRYLLCVSYIPECYRRSIGYVEALQCSLDGTEAKDRRISESDSMQHVSHNRTRCPAV